MTRQTLLDKAIERAAAEGFTIDCGRFDGQPSTRKGSNGGWLLERSREKWPRLVQFKVAIGARKRHKSQGFNCALLARARSELETETLRTTIETHRAAERAALQLRVLKEHQLALANIARDVENAQRRIARITTKE